MLNIFKIWLLYKLHKFIYKAYESIDFLPVWNYKQVEKTGDLRYLIKGIDYEHLPNIYLKLQDIWEKIYNSFAENANPEKILELAQDFDMQRSELNIYNRLYLAYNTLMCYDLSSKQARDYFIKEVRELGYKFNDSTENEYCNSLIDLKRQITGLKRNIDFKTTDKLEEIQKQPAPMDIEDILAMFTNVFPGTVFNSKTLTCKQYLSYLKRYNMIASKANSETQKK